MAAGRNGRHGAKRVHLVETVLRQGIVIALIRRRYMVVPTAVGCRRKLRTAIHLPVQVIVMILSLNVACPMPGDESV